MATNISKPPKKKQKVESKDQKIKRLENELRDIGDIHKNITSILSNTIDELNYDICKLKKDHAEEIKNFSLSEFMINNFLLEIYAYVCLLVSLYFLLRYDGI